MEQGSDVDNICIIITGLRNRFFKPAIQLCSLLRCPDIFIILNIIQDQQIRSPVPVLPASDLLAGANRLHLDIGAGHQNIAPPDFSGQISKIFPDRFVFFKLHTDVIQEALRLIRTIGDNDRIMLIPIYNGVDRSFKRQAGRLGMSTGSCHYTFAAIHPADLLDQLRCAWCKSF